MFAAQAEMLPIRVSYSIFGRKEIFSHLCRRVGSALMGRIQEEP